MDYQLVASILRHPKQDFHSVYLGSTEIRQIVCTIQENSNLMQLRKINPLRLPSTRATQFPMRPGPSQSPFFFRRLSHNPAHFNVAFRLLGAGTFCW
jgi:hypothetical protein